MILFGKKKQMTHVQKLNMSIPVTIIDISDNVVAKFVGEDKVLIGWSKKKKTTMAENGQFKDLGFVPSKTIEVEKAELADTPISTKIIFNEELKKVTLIGISKGKGFAGVVKRYRFAGGPKTHGQSDRQRAPGSIGSGTTPGRVLKGTRMAGRMGSERTHTRNLDVVGVLKEDNGKQYLMVKGAVPGSNGSLVYVKY